MMRFFGSIGVAWLTALVAFIILATGAFYPYHRITSVLLYAASWIPFCLAFRRRRQWLKKHTDAARGFVKDYRWYLAFGLSLILFFYVVLVLVPFEPSPIAHLPDTELSSQISQDTETLLYLDSLILQSLKDLETKTTNSMTAQTLSAEERDALRDLWQRFVGASFEADLIKQRYQTFAQVNGFSRPVIHAETFLLAYGAFLTQYTHALSLQSLVDENIALVTLLNEEDTEGGIPANTYLNLKQRLTHPNDILRLNAGRAYLELMRGRLDARSNLVERIDDFLYQIDSSLEQYTDLAVENPLEKIEEIAFDTWFPLQKNVALNLSYLRTANRDYLISPQMIATYREVLLPGDILLERREWHATNVGIPGYWTHAAMYIGTVEELNAHFSGIPELGNATTVERYIKEQFPNAHAILQTRDARGYRRCIIEAKRPGVIFTSLEDSANADSLAVLRPQVSKSDRFHAVLRAFACLGKPYDYNFDFRTDRALVCSEVIYKAYEGAGGLTLTLQEVNGRPVFPPNLFGKKFDEEFATAAQELDLVLFLDGNEVEATAVRRDEDAFRTSWRRPKWHILKDYATSL